MKFSVCEQANVLIKQEKELHKNYMRVDKRELINESSHESFLNSCVLVKREQESHESSNVARPSI